MSVTAASAFHLHSISRRRQHEHQINEARIHTQSSMIYTESFDYNNCNHYNNNNNKNISLNDFRSYHRSMLESLTDRTNRLNQQIEKLQTFTQQIRQTQNASRRRQQQTQISRQQRQQNQRQPVITISDIDSDSESEIMGDVRVTENSRARGLSRSHPAYLAILKNSHRLTSREYSLMNECNNYSTPPISTSQANSRLSQSSRLSSLSLISCSICSDDFHVGCQLTSVECFAHHIYHTDCIRKWLKRGTKCPLCNFDLNNKNDNNN